MSGNLSDWDYFLINCTIAAVFNALAALIMFKILYWVYEHTKFSQKAILLMLFCFGLSMVLVVAIFAIAMN